MRSQQRLPWPESGVAAHPLWGTPLFSPCPTVSQDLASLSPITVTVGPGGGLPAYSEATVHSLPWGLSKFCSLIVLLLSQQWACPLLTCGGSLPFPLLLEAGCPSSMGWGSSLGQGAFVTGVHVLASFLSDFGNCLICIALLKYNLHIIKFI